MTKQLYLFINVLIFATTLAAFSVFNLASWGSIIAIVIGGLCLGILALLSEPTLTFFKFPINFWGLFLVGLILNSLFFLAINVGLIPGLANLRPGVLQSEFTPLAIRIELVEEFLVIIFLAIVTTLLQITARKLAE